MKTLIIEISLAKKEYYKKLLTHKYDSKHVPGSRNHLGDADHYIEHHLPFAPFAEHHHGLVYLHGAG